VQDEDVQSKMTLAQAYIDVGDLEEARNLLIQALAGGSEQDKKQVQALLDKLNKK
jgi:FimV-like protein